MKGAFSNTTGTLTLNKNSGNPISIAGLLTEGDVEEIVSSIGGAKYITSGFSDYVGHSAIGFGAYQHSSNRIYGDAIGMGTISYDDDNNIIISGLAYRIGDTLASRDKIYLEWVQNAHSCSIVF